MRLRGAANELIINEATMLAVVQEYLDKACYSDDRCEVTGVDYDASTNRFKIRLQELTK